MDVMTHAASKYTTKCILVIAGSNQSTNCTAVYDDFSTYLLAVSDVIACNSTKLTASIDVTLNYSAAAYGEFGTLNVTKFLPVNGSNFRNTIQLLSTSHTAGKYVTALGVKQLVICIKCGIRYIVNDCP